MNFGYNTIQLILCNQNKNSQPDMYASPATKQVSNVIMSIMYNY